MDNSYNFFTSLWSDVFPWLFDFFICVKNFALMKFGNFVDFLLGERIFGTYGNTAFVDLKGYSISWGWVNPFRPIEYNQWGQIIDNGQITFQSPAYSMSIISAARPSLHFIYQWVVKFIPDFVSKFISNVYSYPNWIALIICCTVGILFIKFVTLFFGFAVQILNLGKDVVLSVFRMV